MKEDVVYDSDTQTYKCNNLMYTLYISTVNGNNSRLAYKALCKVVKATPTACTQIKIQLYNLWSIRSHENEVNVYAMYHTTNTQTTIPFLLFLVSQITLQ